jgi:hypothetical protein
VSTIPAGASFQYQAQGSLPFSNPAIAGVISQLSLDLSSSDSIMVTNSSASGSGLISSIAQAFNPFGGPEFEITLEWFNQSGVALDSATIQADIDADLQNLTGNPVISSISGITLGTGIQQPQSGATVQNTPGLSLASLGLGSGSVLIIAVIVILVVAIVIFPETPARVARSFA